MESWALDVESVLHECRTQPKRQAAIRTGTVCLRSDWVAGITMYGYAPGYSHAYHFQWTQHLAAEATAGLRSWPTLPDGDFNFDLEELPALNLPLERGWADAQDVALERWGVAAWPPFPLPSGPLARISCLSLLRQYLLEGTERQYIAMRGRGHFPAVNLENPPPRYSHSCAKRRKLHWHEPSDES